MYKLLQDTVAGVASCVKRVEDNTYIPFDLANRDYQAYLEWIAEGNTAEPADE